MFTRRFPNSLVLDRVFDSHGYSREVLPTPADGALSALHRLQLATQRLPPDCFPPIPARRDPPKALAAFRLLPIVLSVTPAR